MRPAAASTLRSLLIEPAIRNHDVGRLERDIARVGDLRADPNLAVSKKNVIAIV
jgi:hypothetical protein